MESDFQIFKNFSFFYLFAHSFSTLFALSQLFLNTFSYLPISHSKVFKFLIIAWEFVPRLIPSSILGLFSGEARYCWQSRVSADDASQLSRKVKRCDKCNASYPRFLHRPAIRRGQQEQAYLEFDKQLWLFVHHATDSQAADTRLFMFTASGSSPASGLGSRDPGCSTDWPTASGSPVG